MATGDDGDDDDDGDGDSAMGSGAMGYDDDDNGDGRRRQRRRCDGQALKDDGTRELATDDDGQGTRPGGDQRRHSAFIRCNN